MKRAPVDRMIGVAPSDRRKGHAISREVVDEVANAMSREMGRAQARRIVQSTPPKKTEGDSK